MRVVIQRVSQASVEINPPVVGQAQQIKSKIGIGLLILLGIECDDTIEDMEWLCGKIARLRIFSDENGAMNLSIKDVSGEVLLISQFTLHSSTKKGNRPSFIKAAKPEIAIPLYKKFIAQLEKELSKKIQTGEFGSDMKVSLINDGPVTILIDSKNRE